MSGPLTPTDREPRSAQVFRRRTTVVSAYILIGVVVGVAALLTPGEFGHGIFPFLSPLAAALPLVMFALIAGVWPHVVVAEEGVAVHNSFVAYDVPFSVIDEVRHPRIGLTINTTDEKSVPVTAFTSGAGSKTLGHTEAADVLVHAIDNAKEFVKSDPAAKTTRRVEARNVVAAVVSLAVAVGVIYGAAHTYH
jgi:hypothetical protein